MLQTISRGDEPLIASTSYKYSYFKSNRCNFPEEINLLYRDGNLCMYIIYLQLESIFIKFYWGGVDFSHSHTFDGNLNTNFYKLYFMEKKWLERKIANFNVRLIF